VEVVGTLLDELVEKVVQKDQISKEVAEGKALVNQIQQEKLRK